MRIDYENGYYIGNVNYSGKRHGKGTMYYANGKVEEHEYDNGKLISQKDINTGN